jgi:F0F1-type ATP synthase membrane subunit b/b'
MALFQNENAAQGSVNYKSMGKDQLIVLLQSQKSDVEVLNRKLSELANVAEEKKRLAQQVEALTAENAALKAKAADLEDKLSFKDADITDVGSIAEMSFRVNGVMDAAQKAADDYLAKIKEMHDAMQKEYSAYEAAAKQKAEAILKSANEEAESVTKKARKEANDIWNTLQKQFNGIIDGKKSE